MSEIDECTGDTGGDFDSISSWLSGNPRKNLLFFSLYQRCGTQSPRTRGRLLRMDDYVLRIQGIVLPDARNYDKLGLICRISPDGSNKLWRLFGLCRRRNESIASYLA